MISRAVSVKKIKTVDGFKFVTTVYDLTLANYGIDAGLGGECASSYEDDTPYTPRWQEKFTKRTGARWLSWAAALITGSTPMLSIARF